VHNRSCRDDELAEYALLVAVGPAEIPKCVPAAEQALSVPLLTGMVHAEPAVMQESSAMEMDIVAKVNLLASGDMYFAHLHVVQSDSAWCALPCDGPSWELAAPKPKAGSPYLLLEAAIWRQFRKVTLYQFDAAWEHFARNSYSKLCAGSGWSCPAYASHRERAALISVGPWPEELDHDPAGLSKFIKDAFEKVFAEVHKKAGGDNSVIGMTYSGHGGDADGSLFAGTLDSQDAVSLLEELVDAGGKFSIFNFGTNCKEGRWNMLAAMHPFADWILASDLNVGGLKAGDDPAEDLKHIKAKEKLSDVAVLKRTMEARQPFKQAVAEIIKAREQLWLGAMKGAITEQKLRQSISAFDSPKFPAFAASLKTAYQALPAVQQAKVTTEAENSDCDVLVVARFIDSMAPAALFETGVSSHDFRKGKVTLRQSSGLLEAGFRDLRPEYASTRSLFTWDPVTHGLGFNVRGAWLRGEKTVPNCDLKSAVGEPAA